ncbi:NUDIX domain-containing protein [Streptomyces sp. NPDC057575]|uniref:NUDIX domain-containing protein n=1 Tax=unclassified Streptomyces TaxID=2593676 RepID=UPI0036B6F1F9
MGPPGGSLEPGEDHPMAILRELSEELGAENVVVTSQIAERSKEHPVGGRQVRQVEKYFFVHVAPADIDLARANQTDRIQTIRWWALNELRSTGQTVYPLGLVDLIADVLTEGASERHVVLH